MELIEAVKNRKSIRGFKTDAVKQETLKKIVEIACQTPSAMNTQPWFINIITGEPLDNIKRKNIEMLTSGNMPNPDIMSKPYEEEYKKRQVDLAVQIFELMDIGRDDKEKRFEWMQRGFRFFDAPAAFVLSFDKSMESPMVCSDLGGLAQTICLTALAYGLGTCIHGQGIMFPDIIRECVDIPDSQQLFLAISAGVPDEDFPANRLETPRESADKTTTFFGF